MDNRDEEIMVSVIMPVYNHGDYLKQAIESVISQKVNFKYELLIGEDKSSDNSLHIAREYEKNYPEIIKVFAREKNMGGVRNGYDLYKHSKGRYMIHLEGDDYWSDTDKLQKQVDFLESHEEYIACAHRFHVVNKEGEVYYDRDFECQFFQGNPYGKEEFEKGLLLSHINSLMFRNIFKDKNIYTDFWTEFKNMAGDYTLNAVLVLNGKMYCIQDYMSCYRKVVETGSSSFSAMQEKNNKRDLLFQSAVELEEILNREHEINLIARKKGIFASAVFKWYRDGGKHNFHVVRNIIKMSKKPFLYTRWFLYLVTCRFFMNITGRKNDRVKF